MRPFHSLLSAYIQPMRPRCFSQVLLQSSVEHHLRILKRRVIDEPVHLGAHWQRGIETVLYAWCVDAENLAVGIAQLDAGCVDVESARYQFFHLFLLSPGPQAGPGVPECVPEPGLILVYLLSQNVQKFYCILQMRLLCMIVCSEILKTWVVSRIFRKMVCRAWHERSQPAMEASSRAASRCFMFMYFLLPHWVPATWRSRAQTSMRAELPSGKLPTTR